MASNFMIKSPSLHPRNPKSAAFSHQKSPNAFSFKRGIPGITVSCVSKGEREILSDDERSGILAPLGTVDGAVDEKNRVLDEKDGSSLSGGGVSSSSSSDVSEWRWLPWENLPERYKLIGTTALAFVICNMDKLQSKSRMDEIARMDGDASELSAAENHF